MVFTNDDARQRLFIRIQRPLIVSPEAIRLAKYAHGTIRLIYALDTVYLQSTGYMIGEIYDQLRASGAQLLENAKAVIRLSPVPVLLVNARLNDQSPAE